ncbi:MAG TPA: NADH-quinone oxidoreductase subunit NuoK, partial [Terriglobales bacterium]|nr:NADH-quinone oxidoreductase subunit NuoK [Terriglobales bacterium]
MVPVSYYLILSGILFFCGVIGFLIKRNLITIFMSIELMLNGVNLSFVAFAAQWGHLSGQIFVFFVMVVAKLTVFLEQLENDLFELRGDLRIQPGRRHG